MSEDKPKVIYYNLESAQIALTSAQAELVQAKTITTKVINFGIFVSIALGTILVIKLLTS